MVGLQGIEVSDSSPYLLTTTTKATLVNPQEHTSLKAPHSSYTEYTSAHLVIMVKAGTYRAALLPLLSSE